MIGPAAGGHEGEMLRNKWFLVTGAAVVATAVGSVGAGCAASTANPPAVGQSDDSGPGSGADDSGSSSNSDDTGTGSSGFDSATSVQAVTVPFYVSDQFVASGFMGDYTGLTLSQDPTKCKTPRETGAQGFCYTATWVPKVGDAGSDWSGVYWQSPANNWGAKPGKPIASGATKVTFYAAGAIGGEILTVSVGGINANGASASLPYGDSFTVKQPPVTLTTAWTQYSVSLVGTTYTTVLGGFCMVLTATADTSETIYIDDVEWQ
jgi:hypothetical protein